MKIYVVCSREYHSLEVAFRTVKEAQLWIKAHGGERKFDVVAVDLEWWEE